MRIAKYWLKISLLAVASTLGIVTAAYSDIAAGVDFLATQQNADGSYANLSSVATDFQSTSETLRTFDFTGEDGQPGIPLARTFLNSTEQHNTEILSRLILLATQTGNDTGALVTELLQRQNRDGGFGDDEGFDSTVLDTAFALEAIAESGQQPAGVSTAVAYLLGKQAIDGGWALGLNETSVYISALSMRALWHYREAFNGVTEALAGAQNFLFSRRDAATGLWPETHESALALIAIVPNIDEFSQVEAIFTDLHDQQLNDGSWDGGVYATALVLRALASQPTLQSPVNTKGSISGRVVNSFTKQAIASASVIIDSLAITLSTDSSGMFVFNDLDPSAYSLRITASGYSQSNFSSVQVTAGADTSLGNVMLLPSPTTGILQGRVIDVVTGNAIQSVAVSVTGSSSASASTASDGSYSFVGLAPGGITTTVIKDGYLPIVASANIVAGGTLVFNPALTPTGTDTEPLSGTPTTGLLRGIVTDSGTSLPVRSATVVVRSADDNSILGYTDTAVDGTYEIIDLIPGDITIQVIESGFQNVNVNATVSAGNALIFSPGLVRVGDDPASGTGSDVIQEPLPGTPLTGALQGIATDLETSLPLAGVAINVTGSTTASTTTAIDGSYSIADINPGDITVSASLVGYHDVSTNASVVSGNAVIFNPELSPESFVNNEIGSIVGKVIDASSQNPLRFVVVRVVGSSGETSGTTDVDGRFEITDLAPDDYTISFERNGYVSQGFNTVVASSTTVDLQVIELSQALNHVSVYGQLTDVDTAEPIANAVVSVSGSVISAVTDDQGHYRLDGMDIGTHTLVFSATGYNSQSLIFDFSQGGEFEINRRLGLTTNSGVDITFLSADRASYAAYAPVVLQASVINNGSPVEAQAIFSLFNGQDQLVSEFAGTLPGSSDELITFPAGIITSVEANFNTTNLPPGDYRLVGRLVIGDQMVGPATIILDERVTTVSIEPTERVSDISVAVQPAFSAVGITESIELVATVLNRSNAATSVNISYFILEADGSVLRTSTVVNILLPAERDTVVVALDPFFQEFVSAGEHTLNVRYAGGVQPENISGGIINVAPGLRIDPSQSLTPGTVTPDEDKRIRVNIRLQGREVR